MKQVAITPGRPRSDDLPEEVGEPKGEELWRDLPPEAKEAVLSGVLTLLKEVLEEWHHEVAERITKAWGAKTEEDGDG